MEKRLPISERFTLPESRKACREGDIPVSTQEYRRLRGLEKTYALGADVDLTQIIGGVAEGCKRVILIRCDDSDDGCDGPRAVKASALRKFEGKEDEREWKIEWLVERVKKIGSVIVRDVISHLEGYSVEDFLSGDFPSEMAEEYKYDVVKSGVSVGFGEHESTDDWEQDPSDSSEDMRDLFLHELHRFVNEKVGDWMRANLNVEFCGKSIWGSIDVGVRLVKSGVRSNGVDVDVFFKELPKEEIKEGD